MARSTLRRGTANVNAPASTDGSRAPRTLTAIAGRVIGCERCPRLRTYCEKIAREKRRAFRDQTYWGRPIPGFGDPKAHVMIVGLAPAAHGANRTGRMFTGDSSGDWLYAALYQHGFANQPGSTSRDDGLVLSDVYVTAAARCAPPDNRPTPTELLECRRFLIDEIALLDRVRIVITLGAIAHEAWLRAAGWWVTRRNDESFRRPPFAHGRETLMPNGITLISSYHPSRQNTQTGKLSRAAWHEIFARARHLLEADA